MQSKFIQLAAILSLTPSITHSLLSKY